jgi:hypothetical protein
MRIITAAIGLAGCTALLGLAATTTGAAEKQRAICWRDGHYLWQDTRIAVTRGEFIYLKKPVPAVSCACIDLVNECFETDRQDCRLMFSECLNTTAKGGQFCIPNETGGNSCYR